MDMPKPWVILISVELFWPKSLSYFEGSALVIQKQANWVIFGHENRKSVNISYQNCIIHEYFVLTHTNFKAPRVIFLIIHPKYAESLSYFPKGLELFSKPWVILPQKSLSYFRDLEKKAWHRVNDGGPSS